MNRGTCRTCGEAIGWATTVQGKAMPVELEPDAKGNVDLVYIGGEEVALVLGPADAVAAQASGHELRLSHFATCPHAGDHRKRRP